MRGATILKASDDKTRQLNKHTLMAFSGEAGDTGEFVHQSSHSSSPSITFLTTPFPRPSSPVRRVHPSKHPTLQHAPRHRPDPARHRLVRPHRASQGPPQPQTLQREPPSRRLRHHNRQALPVLVRLSRVARSLALRRPRLRPVLLPQYPRQAPPPGH